MQDDSSLPSALRKNAHLSIFCTKESATGFFGRTSNNISTAERNKYVAAAEEIFKDYNQTDYKKIIFCKHDSKHPIKYIKGDEDDFRMCAKVLWHFNEKIKKVEDTIEEDNEWSSLFFDT